MSSINYINNQKVQSTSYSPIFSSNSNKVGLNVITEEMPVQCLDEVPLKNKETYLTSQLAILSEENEMIRQNLNHLGHNDFYNEDLVMEEEELMNDLIEFKRYRKEMEQKLQNFENRVKHMNNKNENIVKEITNIDTKTIKIKDIKKYKNKHENVVVKAKEEKSLAIKLKRDKIYKDQYQRDQNVKNLKMNNARNKMQNCQEVVKEKEKNYEIKDKMELYEKILLENKRLRSAYQSKKLEVNREEQEVKQN